MDFCFLGNFALSFLDIGKDGGVKKLKQIAMICFNTSLFCWRHVLATFVLCMIIVRLGTSAPTHYETLLLFGSFTMKDVKKNYKKLALEYHPDKLPLNTTEEERDFFKLKFFQIQEAYDTLSDPEKKLVYDMSLQGSKPPSIVELNRYESRPFKTIIKQPGVALFFSMNFDFPEIEPVEVTTSVDLKANYFGHVGTKSFYRKKVCTECGGNGGNKGQYITCRMISTLSLYYMQISMHITMYTSLYSPLYPGKCVTCPQCLGEGVAKHLLGGSRSKYQQMTETTCGRCLGKKCVPEVCSVCTIYRGW